MKQHTYTHCGRLLGGFHKMRCDDTILMFARNTGIKDGMRLALVLDYLFAYFRSSSNALDLTRMRMNKKEV